MPLQFVVRGFQPTSILGEKELFWGSSDQLARIL